LANSTRAAPAPSPQASIQAAVEVNLLKLLAVTAMVDTSDAAAQLSLWSSSGWVAAQGWGWVRVRVRVRVVRG